MTLRLLVYLLAFACTAYGQVALTVDDLVVLKELGYSDEKILETVKKTGVDMTPKKYLQLRKAGFSTELLKQMTAMSAGPRFPLLAERLKRFYRRNSSTADVWVLAVGIDKYRRFQNFPPLRYAVEDAESFVRHMLSIGVPPQQVCLLSGQQVTRDRLLGVLDELEKVEGQLYFFYSGHGLYSTRDGFFFTCYDTNPENLERTAYAMAELKEKLDSASFKNSVLFIDACHSGAAKGAKVEFFDEQEQAPEVRLGEMGQGAQADFIGLDDNEQPVLIITSCSADQVSREGKGNGLFTQSLLAGLSGKADFDDDGWVDLKEALTYVNQDIPQRTQFAQRPDYSFSRSWSWEEEALPAASEVEAKPETEEPEQSAEAEEEPEQLDTVADQGAEDSEEWQTIQAPNYGVRYQVRKSWQQQQVETKRHTQTMVSYRHDDVSSLTFDFDRIPPDFRSRYIATVEARWRSNCAQFERQSIKDREIGGIFGKVASYRATKGDHSQLFVWIFYGFVGRNSYRIEVVAPIQFQEKYDSIYHRAALSLEKTEHRPVVENEPTDRLQQEAAARRLYRHGRSLQKQKQYRRAIQVFSLLLSKAENARVYNQRGICYLKLRKYDNAKRDFASAIRLDPDLAIAYYNMARVYSSERDKKGIWFLQQALYKGFDDLKRILKDEDLKFLRHTKEFRKLMRSYARHEKGRGPHRGRKHPKHKHKRN